MTEPPVNAPAVKIHDRAPRYLENPDDDDYARAARWALQNDDLPLALEQVSAALALRPLHAPHLGLCDDLLRRASCPLELLNLQDGEIFFGSYAVRARWLARLSRFEEAVSALFTVAIFRKDLPFLKWACAWVERKKAAAQLDPSSLAARLIALTEAVRLGELGPGEQVNLESAVLVGAAVQRRHPENAELRAALSRALRLLGKYEEARIFLEQATCTSWAIAVERAALARDRNQLDERVRWLQLAVELRPSEPAGFCDLADAWLDLGQPRLAHSSYERALALGDVGWARIGLAYAEATESKRPVQLLGLGVSDEQKKRARALEADSRAYLDRLCDPIDPIVGVIRSVAERATASSIDANFRVRAHAERPLAPSAQRAFSQLLANKGRLGSLEVICDRAPVAGLLWSEERSTLAHSTRAVEAASSMASTPFTWQAWCEAARTFTLTSVEDCAAIARAMAKAPPPPKRADTVHWTHGFQIAVALLVAHSSASRVARSACLLELLAEADDWSSAAAILGLRALAEGCPEASPEILEKLHACLPSDEEALFPAALALAVTGDLLAQNEARTPFLRLRARIRRELAETEREANASAARATVPNGR